MSTLTWQIIGLLLLLVVSAFFSSSETALFSLSRGRVRAMERSDRPSRRRVAELLRSPRRLLVSILIGNTLVNVGSASMATVVAIGLFSDAGSAQSVEQGMLWATVIMTILILFFGEIAPKSFAIEHAEGLSQATARPLALFIRLLGPLGTMLDALNSGLLRLVGSRQLEPPDISSEELAAAVAFGHDEGFVDAFERDVVNNILTMEEGTIGEVMTPRVDVKSLDVAAPEAEWAAAFGKSGYSRLPLIDGDLDHVVGVLYAKDYIAVRLLGTGPIDPRALARKSYFVAESMKSLELLHEFRRQQRHFALVIDEYGSVSGVVTMEDLLEEIVGELADSRDVEEAAFKLLEPGVAVVFAGSDLDEFSAAVGVPLQDDHAETVAGWLVNRLGRIPRTGETLNVSGFRIHVLSAGPTRVHWLRVEWKTR